MKRLLLPFVFVLGLAVPVWVGVGFVGSSGFALLMTLLIGLVYVLGAVELHQYRLATASLAAALAALPRPVVQLDDWLRLVPSTLRTAVRLRIEGARGALPNPALTPYLVGLLVMLGMLGTFLGMVVTFKGVVLALEGATDLEAVRAALAAPIRGLGLSFGTSVAGVAASAMLGLMSALSRRERLHVAQQLDGRIADELRPFSRAHQREESARALQLQAQALPAVAERLLALMERMDGQRQQLDADMSSRQAQFHSDVTQAYTSLAQAVGRSLQESLAAAVAKTSVSMQPVLETALAQLAQESRVQMTRCTDTLQAQLDQVSRSFAATAGTVAQGWSQAQQQQAQTHESLVARMELALQASADGLQRQWQQVGAETLAQGQVLCQTLERTTQTLQDGLGQQAERLQTLGAALQQEQSRRQADAQQALAQQAALMARIDAQVLASQQAAQAQQAAIDALVAAAATVLERANERFALVLDGQAAQAAEGAAQVQAGAMELGSLGSAFQLALAQFSASNETLVGSLQAVESALGRSLLRSDEQLAYYVGQAREVIDLSLGAQQALVEELRRLQAPARELAGVAL